MDLKVASKAGIEAAIQLRTRLKLARFLVAKGQALKHRPQLVPV